MKATSRYWLSATMAIFFLNGCFLERRPHACPLQGTGLSLNPIKGRSLKTKQFSLTFDDGPTPVSEKIGNYLKQNDISATFFVQGSRLEGNSDIASRLRDQGHLVANHTFNHADLVEFYDPVAQMRRTDRLIAPFISGNIYLFRPPYGSLNEVVIEKINSTELRKYVGPIDFDIGGNATTGADWKCWEDNIPIENCAEMYLKQMQEGEQKGIVLFHDLREQSYELVLWLIPRMKEAGFSFIALDEVPEVKEALEKSGAQPGVRGGPPGCSAEPNP